jgi:acyl-coenzyme A synthetase/AMP-(fatty) acid ligase
MACNCNMEKQNEAFNIVDLFFEQAKSHPFKSAIIFQNDEISFGNLAQQINDTANFFLHKGISKGDRVLVFVPMSIDLYRIVLALFKIGATAVFLDEWVSKQRLEVCCKLSQCKAFIGIFKARIFSLFSAALRSIPINLGTSYQVIADKIPLPVTYHDDAALITFTTGSTGIPKAAIRTHNFLYQQFKALQQKLNSKPEDISMTVLPIVLLINLATGTTSVIATFKASKPDTLKPGLVVDQIKKHHINTIIASPFFVKKISAYMIAQQLVLPGISKIFTGGAPVFPSEAAIYHRAFSDAKTEIVYGSTEAEPIMC